MKAAEKNHTKIALALISAGAHVNIADKVRKLCLSQIFVNTLLALHILKPTLCEAFCS